MKSILRDSRFIWRTFFKNPGFVVTVVFSMALGITANMTVFSWIQTFLLHPLSGVEQGERLVTLETGTTSGHFVDTSYPDYRDYRDQTKSLSGLIVFKEKQMVIGDSDNVEWVWGEMVSGNFFDVLRVKPKLGRFFLPEEQQESRGAHPVAVISTGLWKRSFNSDPRIIGKIIRLNSQPFSVIGVTPEDFKGTIVGLSYDLWVPIFMMKQVSGEDSLDQRDARSLHVLGRLAPGVTVDRARLEIKDIARQLAQDDPKDNKGITATILPIWKAPYGAQSLLATLFGILMGVAILVLLIVCANIANILLARAAARRKEISVRFALGASRVRVIWQMLVESLFLALLGCFVGVVFTFWTKDTLRFMLPFTNLPLVLSSRMDMEVLGFTVVLAVIAGVIFGLAPALQATKVNLAESLNQGGRSGSTSSSHRLRRLLVVSEVVFAFIALVGAGLFVKSFENAKKIQLGFDPDHVLLVGMNLSPIGIDKSEGKVFFQQLHDRITELPSVHGVSFAEIVPLGFDGGSWAETSVEGYLPQTGESMKIYRNIVAPGYFDVMRIPLLEGRDFTENDNANSDRVMIVNETFVKRFFHGENPIGRTVKLWTTPLRVIGVVANCKYRTLAESPSPYMYLPFHQFYRTSMGVAIHIRTLGDPTAVLPQVRSAIRSLRPDVAIVASTPLTNYISASFFAQRLAVILLSILAGVSLILALLGLYGVIAYSVSQRTKEFGIRMALGAQKSSVTGLIMKQGLTLVFIGMALGIGCVIALSHVASSLLFGVAGTDFATLGFSCLVLSTIAMVATFVPARRAIGIDPLIALRYE